MLLHFTSEDSNMLQFVANVDKQKELRDVDELLKFYARNQLICQFRCDLKYLSECLYCSTSMLCSALIFLMLFQA